MTLTIQFILWILPSFNRLMSFIELIIVAIIGVVVLGTLIIYWRILSHRELEHLPFGDKLYDLKRGKKR